ncbi:MAG: ribosomal-processing cysteine protease Prp [Clostridia bacterium]|nr:ribosomal-processing cysteine protease Prp [Clostridia bacterium]
MTKITFFKRNGVYYGFRETGHSEYADEGYDIVCSALSAMTMLIINTVEISYASRVDYTIDEKTTDITVKIKSALPEYEKDEKKQFAIAGLLQGYFYQLMDLTEDYYDFLSVEEIEDK